MIVLYLAYPMRILCVSYAEKLQFGSIKTRK